MHKRLLVSAIVLSILCLATAWAEPIQVVRAVRRIPVYSAPDLSTPVQGYMREGEGLEYLGEKLIIDDEGVEMYRIWFNGYESAWVASTYSTIESVDLPTDEGVMTRRQIVEKYGILGRSQLLHVTNVETERGADRFSHRYDPYVFDRGLDNAVIDVRLMLESDVFGYGSDCYQAFWLQNGGIISDTYVDLDSDGVEEWVLIYIDWDITNEYDENWPNGQWRAAVYEPQDDGYVLSDVCMLFDTMVPGGSERSVWISYGDEQTYIATGESWYADGGTGGIEIRFFSYDGIRTTMCAISDTERYRGASFFEGDIDSDFDHYEFYGDYDHEKENDYGIRKHLFWSADESEQEKDWDWSQMERKWLDGFSESNKWLKSYGMRTCGELVVTDENREYFRLWVEGVGSPLVKVQEGFVNEAEDDEIEVVDIRLISSLDHNR